MKKMKSAMPKMPKAIKSDMPKKSAVPMKKPKVFGAKMAKAVTKSKKMSSY